MSLARLRALAAGLCADRRIRLEEGAWWAFHPASNTIFVPPEDTRDADDRVTAGLVAHEVGHVWLSRYTAFPLDGLPRAAAHLFLNAIEDGRVETWMWRRYPGIGAWLQAVREESQSLPTTPFLQYLLACAREGAQPPRPFEVPTLPQVAAALEATRPAREAYRLDYLPPVNVRPPLDTYLRYDAEVARCDEADDPSSEAEAWIRVLSHRAVVMAQTTLFPHAAALYEEEIATVAWALGAANLEGRALSPGPRNPFSLVRTAFLLRGDREVDAWGAHRDLAQTIVDDAYTRFSESARAPRRIGMGPTDKPTRVAVPASRVHPESERPMWVRELLRESEDVAPTCVPYDVLLARTIDLREQLRVSLLPAFPQGRATDPRSARRGRTVSLARAFAAEASRTAADSVFLRPARPGPARLALALLVDTSGSMQGPKLENALLAVVAIGEVLSELGVPFCVAGFQDQLLEVAPPGDRWDDRARARLVGLQLEAAGCCPGGHNVPENNDDGPCLLDAVAGLLTIDADDRWVFVLTDGCPAGRHSGPDDLRFAVASFSAPGSKVRVVGIGVGEDTEAVRDFYPQHIAGVPIEALATELVRLLERCVHGTA